MVAENVQNIRERILTACARVNRRPEEVTLIAVAKTFTSDKIREVVRAGVSDIGENYVQELHQKQQELADEQIRWHFIGHLQSNKVKHILGSVHLIHSVDSLPLGQEISKRAVQIGRTAGILVEVNTSGETSKYGVSPHEAPDLVGKLLHLPNITVAGLMTIGPFLPDPEQSRPAFRILRQLQQELEGKHVRLPHLSMGMTNDFEVAIEEGSTMIRIGTAIFGRRQKRNAAAVSDEGIGS
ncbi:MAG: YggS family pyridoxal phosphate-dependent enzyme [Ignavibacteriae bacterium]|nr:YggS family pyridoxal phosphate-dependent enzyme [Ignavibacteria bacterium]MBI3364644.1 YggS family pyridoxal phosphate-dependent enzyme [Ignavibacteriota bacterium]